ncbi:tyrosine-type recombinase/integrase [Falsirhodobacter deserti]|uniref:tyrosine-type recombinase/integrase n=1 Tax=Falsirhodobacter deserti TaxID=1365611 RepID=UPI0019D46F14|nr:integrase arm-type DNA-binding domain-containing protein [Falsirhodobacter deserti]
MLTNIQAKRLKAGDSMVAVGGVTGLYLSPGKEVGTGKFLLRFKSPVSGKRRDMGLGTFPELGLADARGLAAEARAQIAKGLDPIDERRAAKDEQVHRVPNFEEAARAVFETLAPGYRNAKHRDQWISSLEFYVFPKLGMRQVDGLSVGDFAQVLKPIWLEKEETASRVKQRCERVMMWCVAHRHCDHNPLSAVLALLPKQRGTADRVQHHPAAPWRALPALVSNLTADARLSISSQALLFLILTAARSGEVRGATWDEIDFKTATWTVPAERMKAGRQHRVPLSRQAVELLSALAKIRLGGKWIFTARGTSQMSDMTLTKVLRLQQFPSDVPGRPATAHGFDPPSAIGPLKIAILVT